MRVNTEHWTCVENEKDIFCLDRTDLISAFWCLVSRREKKTIDAIRGHQKKKRSHVLWLLCTLYDTAMNNFVSLYIYSKSIPRRCSAGVHVIFFFNERLHNRDNWQYYALFHIQIVPALAIVARLCCQLRAGTVLALTNISSNIFCDRYVNFDLVLPFSR